MGIAIALWYGIQNVLYWLFGFKYWVISIEMPLVIEAKDDKYLERNEKKKNRFGQRNASKMPK
jgi:hypothetical protein